MPETRCCPAAARVLLPLLLWCGFQAAFAFDVQGHRGARGLAPENTLAAFKTAIALGVSTLELDVGLTRDGVVVIAHDRRLNADITRDAQGRWLPGPGPALHELTLAEVQQYNVGRINPASRYAQTFAQQQPADGARIPTLAALFESVHAQGNTRVAFNIETKIDPRTPDETATPEVMARALLAVIRQHGMQGRVTVQSFDWRTLKLVQQLEPTVPTAALSVRQPFLDNVSTGEWNAGLKLAEHGGSVPRLVKASGAAIWSPFHGDLTQPLLAEARALGLKVLPWTVNAPDAIERFIDWQVDGLISDNPDRVLQALAKRGITVKR